MRKLNPSDSQRTRRESKIVSSRRKRGGNLPVGEGGWTMTRIDGVLVAINSVTGEVIPLSTYQTEEQPPKNAT